MTIIFEQAGEFWIEQFTTIILVDDPAAAYDGPAVTLQRAGVYLGSSVFNERVTTSATYVRETGLLQARQGNGDILAFGDEISQCLARLEKPITTVGSTGNLTVQVLLFMRKIG